VKGDRTGVGAVPDDGQHLPPRTVFASCDKRLKKARTDSTALEPIGDIDGILHRVQVGRSRPIACGVAKAHNTPSDLGDEIGEAEAENARAA
jgi:hypothetical protein